jgi:serine/threonine protein kinase
MENGSLLRLFEQKPSGFDATKNSATVFGLAIVHRWAVVHRDFKPENIVFDKNLERKNTVPD